MSLRFAATAALVVLFAGCSSPQMLLRTTTTGGDAHPKVRLDPTGQPDLSGINVGDTIAVSPGSMRSVVGSPEVKIVLFEPGSVTEAEAKKSLAMNRREGAKIEVMKGQLLKGDFFIQQIGIDLQSSDPKKFDIDLVLLAFNRGEKPFRGDLTVYDLLPPELSFKAADTAAKYNDRRNMKGALTSIPIFGLLAMGMDNFSRSSEAVEMQHERVGEMHKYTFQRLVLDPGQAVGFTIRLRYVPPTDEELIELRQDAKRFLGPGQQ